jgi:hypothetical protein
MRTISLLLALTFVSLYANPTTVSADMTTESQSPVIKKMFTDWVAMRDLVRRLKMEISDLQAKIGATILTDGDRANMNSLLEEDMDKLRDTRSSYQDGTQNLMAHWSELTLEQQFAVQEANTFPE